MEYRKNQLVELAITEITDQGSGVGRLDDFVVFVPFAAVGDRLRVKMVKVNKTYAYGIIDEILIPSPDRIPSDCPAFGRCGGCAFRHIGYKAELAAKKNWVESHFKRLGGIDIQVSEVIPSPMVDRYRNKAVYPVGLDKDGNAVAGFFALNSHRIVPQPDCRLHPRIFGEIVGEVIQFTNERGVPVYDEQSHTGVLRHIYLRQFKQNELMLCLVINADKLPFAKAFAEMVAAKFPQVKSLLLNVNKREANAVLGERFITLAGSGVMADELSGVSMRISPGSFYQVNRAAAPLLFAAAAELAMLKQTDVVYDIYCGAGVIGLSLAHRVKEVIGVEVMASAVENARQNAMDSGIKNAKFYQMDASRLDELISQGEPKPDVVILDPPRKGCGPELLETVASLAPERIVYISCNSATQARDCKLLAGLGYAVKELRLADMFPRTANTETVALLVRNCKL